jgi:DNA-binding transcriptional LysR family regulator
VLLMRQNHPLCKSQNKPSLEDLTHYPVIRLYISDRGQLESQSGEGLFDSIGAKARGSLEISHLMTAMEVLRSTDYFMPGPAFLTQNESIGQDIAALPVPGIGDNSVDYVLAAHQRTENSPLHNWLWEEITCTIRELRPTQPRKPRQRIAAGAG